MKTGKKNNKKKKYTLPEINKHDVKSLTSDWNHGAYGLIYPSNTGCGPKLPE